MSDKPIRGWNISDIPNQSGRVCIVTGANSGIGYEISRALARAGATVIVAGRNAEKCLSAIQSVQQEQPKADLRFVQFDLANLASVSEFASRVSAQVPHVDVLINNAGIMAPPHRKTTADGFELQFGVNFLGHFALTAQLLKTLRRAAMPRVVTLSSVVHKAGRIDLDDLQWEKRTYSPTGAYHDSKLATLMFALELQRRSDAGRWGIHSMAAHPGIARTELMANGPGLDNFGGKLFSWVIKPFFSHSAQDGALAPLFAATAVQALDGGYYGPAHRFELIGPPTSANIAKRARDLATAAQLWERAEALAGLRFI